MNIKPENAWHSILASPARADLFGPLGQALQRALHDATGARDAAPPALHVEAAPVPTVPDALSLRQPGGATAQRAAKALYLRCLAHYREQVQHGLPQDELGTALAYFVLANLAALNDVQADEATLARVGRQMRACLAGSSTVQAAPTSERQALFETLAVLGVLIGECQARARPQGSAALANVRRAARGYVVQLLALDPDSLEVDDHGLRLRVHTPRPEPSRGHADGDPSPPATDPTPAHAAPIAKANRLVATTSNMVTE